MGHEIEYREEVWIELPPVDGIVRNLKNISSEGLLKAKILKEAWDIMGCEVLSIVNNSMVTCTVSESLKVSCITPILKVPNSILMSDFRPINVLPLVDKILETIIFVKL